MVGNERESKGIEPHLLTPEYWNGHNIEDECTDDFDERLKERSAWDIANELATSLREINKSFSKLLAVRGKESKVLAPHEEFSPTNYPEGTIIGFDREGLFFSKDKAPVYKNDYFWGVVFGYQEGKERKKSLVLVQIKSKNKKSVPIWYPQLVSIEEGSITNGEVIHRIRNNGKKNEKVSFPRFNNIGIYETGEGFKKKERRAFMPRRGLIFRPQHGIA